MKNKNLMAILVVFIGVMLVAGILYSRLGAQFQTQGLVAATTEPIPESTETTERYVPDAVDFTVKDADGNDVKLSDYFGKPIVLNFWAHWCGPCQKEMPEFNTRYEELGGDVVFLMVHADSNTAKGKELVDQNGYTFPVVFDETRQAAAYYGVTAFPTTFLIDAQGKVQAYYVGIMTGELLQAGIDMIYTPQK